MKGLPLAQKQAVSKVMAGSGSFSEEVQKMQSKDSQEVAIRSTSQMIGYATHSLLILLGSCPLYSVA